jgi:predicted permease
VAVLSHAYWTNRFGTDPDVIDRTIAVKDVTCTIVGVTPRDYFGRETAGQAAAVTVPMVLQPRLTLKDHLDFEMLGRSNAGAAPDIRTRAAGRCISSGASRRLGNAPTRHIELQSAGRGDTQDDRFVRQVWVLQAVGAIVLLIAIVNVASLQVARGIGRQHELTVRLALGATRRQLIRQLLVESALVSSVGGLLGLCVARHVSSALVMLMRNAPSADTPVLHAPTLAFDAASIVVAAIASGIVPALRLTRLDAAADARTGSLRTRAPLGTARAGRSLVATQIALSLVLLLPAGLLTRSVEVLARVDLGFSPDRLIEMWIFPTLAGFDGARELDLYAQLLDRLNDIPGVRSASFSRYSILRRGRALGLTVESDPQVVDPAASYGLNATAPSFFDALGLRVVAGRDFSRFDTPTSACVAVINEALVRRYFGGEVAVGRRLRVEDGWRKIVGVVANMRFGVRDAQASPAVYIPYTQAPEDMLGQMLLKIRTASQPAAVVPLTRQELHAIAPTLAPVSIETASADIANATSSESSLSALVGVSAALAMRWSACMRRLPKRSGDGRRRSASAWR